MNIKEEFEKMTESLKKQRDELAVKAHLAEMEAKDEWEKAEKQWDKFSAKANEIFDETVETSEEVVAAAKVIGEELKEAYQRIKARL